MGSDSEIAEVGRFLKQQRRDRKAVRTNRWVDRDHQRLFEFLSETFGVELGTYTEHHYYFRIGNMHYDYWPSNNRLRHKSWKASKFMNVDRLIPYLKERHASDMTQS